MMELLLLAVARRNIEVRRSTGSYRRSGLATNSPATVSNTPLTPWAQPLRVGFILTNEFTLSALATFIDVLRLAGEEADRSRDIRCQWHVMASSVDPIRASCGLTISPTIGLLDPGSLDYIVVVGGHPCIEELRSIA